jgi:site-specific DNA-cytosine methylase
MSGSAGTDGLLNVADLLGGCGGLGTGLFHAGGFRIAAACECDPAAAATYRLNHPGVNVIPKDITLLDRDSGTRSEVALQIGKAVPSPLAKAVGLAVLEALGVGATRRGDGFVIPWA